MIDTLYTDRIIEHGEEPRHVGRLARATHRATFHNPLCGDRITLQLRVERGIVRDIRYQITGCLIARASASLLSDWLKGKKLAAAKELTTAAVQKKLGITLTPARLECALVIVHALERV